MFGPVQEQASRKLRHTRNINMTSTAKSLNYQLVTELCLNQFPEQLGSWQDHYMDHTIPCSLTPTNAEVKLIDKPDSNSIFAALNRVRFCYPELPSPGVDKMQRDFRSQGQSNLIQHQHQRVQLDQCQDQ